MGRKALAILAYVGLSGSASRESLAALLWENGKARASLRVELHRLAEALGRPAFDMGEDPLRLPPWIEVDGHQEEGELMEGLAGISSEFDRWIDTVRSRSRRAVLQNRRAAGVARRLVEELRPPFLVVARTRPGEALDDFATALADALHLPLVEGLGEPSRALHVLVPPYPHGAVEAVLRGREGAWALGVPAYGEDPRLVLELRNAYDPGRVRYVEVPPVSWEDARADLLADLPFEQAAEAYLWTGGNAGFLRELDRMEWEREPDGHLPVPQRLRAAYQLEVRHASMSARLALERLSIHPGHLTDGLIEAFEAQGELDELERRGWLVFDGAWRFRNAEARRVLCRSLQRGRRTGYHLEAARQMAVEGRWLAEVFHRLAAGQPFVWATGSSAPKSLVADAVRAYLGMDVIGDKPSETQVTIGEEQALLEAGDREGVQGEGASWRIVRMPGDGRAEVGFEATERLSALRLQGRAWSDTPMGVGIDGASLPLSLDLGDGRKVVFVHGLPRPVQRGDKLLLMPFETSVDAWFLVSARSEVRLTSSADAAVIELQLTMHEVVTAEAEARHRPGVRAVTAASFGIGSASTERTSRDAETS